MLFAYIPVMAVEIFDTVEALQEAAAARVENYIREGGTDIALAGGNTPRPVHERLAATDLPWDKLTLWLGDERWVPPDHEDSNIKMVRETLADSVPARFLTPETAGSDPAITAAHYEIALRGALRTDATGRLSPGLVMLGMGDDGHTASLFPGTTALDESDRDYVAVWVPDKATWRLTATFPALHAADAIVFMVTGVGKAQVVREILEDAAAYPAQRVAAGSADVTWLLDAAAASQLRR